jgi:hypothetical protein
MSSLTSILRVTRNTFDSFTAETGGVSRTLSDADQFLSHAGPEVPDFIPAVATGDKAETYRCLT